METVKDVSETQESDGEGPTNAYWNSRTANRENGENQYSIR